MLGGGGLVQLPLPRPPASGSVYMPELLRSIVARVRGYVADRRRAPRFRLRVPCSVAPFAPGGAGMRRAPQLTGHTRDLSASGLALILPAVRIGGHYLTGADTKLRVVLELANGPLELVATPVHYDQLGAEGEEQGYLIGLRIAEMSAAARARYEAQLKQLA